MMGLTGIADGADLAHPGGLVAVAANHDGDPNMPDAAGQLGRTSRLTR